MVSEKKIKVGVIGTGMGRMHIKAFSAMPGVTLAAVCDLNKEEASQLAEQYDVSRVFIDYEDLIAMEEIDAVSMAVPNFLHAEMAIAALEAGKHVLCEKPIAVNLKDANAMVAAADTAQRRLMINQSFRFHENTQILTHYAREGAFGDIYFARASWLRRKGFPAFNLPPEVAMGRGVWFLQKDKAGGGALFDLGVHMLDLGWYLMGCPKPVAISGMTFLEVAKETLQERGLPTQVEELAVAQIRFENNAILHCSAAWDMHQPSERLLTLFGSQGGASLFPAEIYRGQDVMETVSLEVPIGGIRTYSAYEHFIDCIQNPKQAMIASGQEATEVLRMIEAINQSAKTGREVAL